MDACATKHDCELKPWLAVVVFTNHPGLLRDESLQAKCGGASSHQHYSHGNLAHQQAMWDYIERVVAARRVVGTCRRVKLRPNAPRDPSGRSTWNDYRRTR